MRAAGRASALTHPSRGPRDPWGELLRNSSGKTPEARSAWGSNFYFCPRPRSAPPRPAPRPASPLTAALRRPCPWC